MDFIVTYTGVKFYILNPKPDDINERDIAHALSLLCRGNGHLYHFYSVAQHSLNCYYEAVARGYSKRLKLALLLHDASEAYISDITRPVKRNLSDYCEIEKMIQDCVYKHFGLDDLTEQELEIIKEIDDNMLCIEFNDNHIYKDFEMKSEMKAPLVLDFVDFKEIEGRFLTALTEVLQ